MNDTGAPPPVCRVGESLILGTMMVGQAVAFAPSYNSAKLSAARVFALLDRRPRIPASHSAGLKLVSRLVSGRSSV